MQQIPLLIKGITFPRPMRWGDLDFCFIRPIRWLVSLLDHQIVNFEIAGLSPGNYTYGLRNFHTEPIKINSIEDYFAKLREASGDPGSGRTQRDDLEARSRGRLPEQGGISNQMMSSWKRLHILWKVLTPLSGSFDHRFLKLPPEVVITPMREHQRYSRFGMTRRNFCPCLSPAPMALLIEKLFAPAMRKY